MMPREIGLLIDDQIYTGWKKISVSRSMEALAGSFSLDLVQSSVDAANAIQPGQRVAVLITDGVRDAQLLDGYIDSKTTTDGAGGITISVSGRDRTADLVDCSAVVKSSTWSSATLKKICDDLLAPFGLSCLDYAEKMDPLKNHTIQSGDTVHATIETACRARGVLPLTDRWGNLTLVNSTGQVPSVDRIEHGYNLLEMVETWNVADRFSRYIVKGSTSTDDGDGWTSDSVTLKGEADDAGVARYRPLIVNAEGKPTASSVKTRAAWEAQVRAGRSKSYRATVRGWIQGDDSTTSAFTPWDINQVAPVKNDVLGVDADFLITSVEYTYDDDGEITVIELKHPDTYKADPTGGINV